MLIKRTARFLDLDSFLLGQTYPILHMSLNNFVYSYFNLSHNCKVIVIYVVVQAQLIKCKFVQGLCMSFY